jgi:biotin operon repressor
MEGDLMAKQAKPVMPSHWLGSQTAADLLAKELPPVEYVVPGYIPEGLTILAGRPKLGKSWLSLGLAVAVATGGLAFGSIPVKQGIVLYLALEDNERRLQQRLKQLLPQDVKADALFIETQCARLDEGGKMALGMWMSKTKNVRMIIIDVFNKVRPERNGNDTPYEADYHALAFLKSLADKHGIAVVIVHHTRKMAAEDPFDTVSGTTGLTGAADTVLVLNKDSRGVTLYGRGRDIHEIEVALSFDRTTGAWAVAGPVAEIRRSDERHAVLAALEEADGPMSPAEIAEELKVSGANIRQLLRKMVQAGEVETVGRGRYIPGREEAIEDADHDDHMITDERESA